MIALQSISSTMHFPFCAFVCWFTGKERDAESGNDYFGARYYGSSMGRFMSPDPSGPLEAKPQYPQSWNMYAYAMNNPLINIDPTGLDCVYADDSGNAVEEIDHNNSLQVLLTASRKSSLVKNPLADDHLTTWKRQIEALASAFLLGHADINPRADETCKRCSMANLCRIGERTTHAV